MTEKLIDGKKVSLQIRENIATEVEKLKTNNLVPGLVVVLVGDDPASAIYVRNKEKSAQKLGMHSETFRLSASISQEELLTLINKLNADDNIHGILVQLPLPDQIDEEKILNSIHPTKDVDCFHPENVGRLVIGRPYLLPCTPAGIIEMLKAYNISTSGKNIVIAGRSNIVGKPMANILVQKQEFANATVTVVHSRTQNIENYFKNADIIIAAMGSAQFIKASMVKEGVVIIDVGMNRISADNEKGYKLVGDADFDELLPKVSKITPVPGGVGPMTITMLLHNTVEACKKAKSIGIMEAGIATSIAIDNNYSWADTTNFAQEQQLNSIQYYVPPDYCLPIISQNYRFKNIYLHLPSDYDVRTDELIALSEQFERQYNSNKLIIHQKEQLSVSQQCHIIDKFNQGNFCIGIENEGSEYLESFFELVQFLKRAKSNFFVVADIHRFYFNFIDKYSEMDIYDKITAFLDYCDKSKIAIVLHVIDSLSFKGSRDDWIDLFHGIVPYNNLLKSIRQKNINIESLIFEYEKYDHVKNSLENLRKIDYTIGK